MADAYHQVSVMSKTYPLGSAEAEATYQRAREYREGHGKYPRDKMKATDLFYDAFEMGNSKAPLALGEMLRDASNAPANKRYKQMIQFYEKSA